MSNIRKVVILTATIIVLFLSPSISNAAVNMFLCVDGFPDQIQPDQTVSRTIKANLAGKSCINISAWSFGLSQSGTTHQGNGLGQGKVTIQDITITKYIDVWSSLLFIDVASGVHNRSASLYVFATNPNTGNPYMQMSILLTDILIDGVTTGGSGGQDRISENVSINFGKIEYDEFETNGVKHYGCWNIVSNGQC